MCAHARVCVRIRKYACAYLELHQSREEWVGSGFCREQQIIPFIMPIPLCSPSVPYRLMFTFRHYSLPFILYIRQTDHIPPHRHARDSEREYLACDCVPRSFLPPETARESWQTCRLGCLPSIPGIRPIICALYLLKLHSLSWLQTTFHKASGGVREGTVLLRIRSRHQQTALKVRVLSL